jgi:hypothetical protein
MPLLQDPDRGIKQAKKLREKTWFTFYIRMKMPFRKNFYREYSTNKEMRLKMKGFSLIGAPNPAFIGARVRLNGLHGLYGGRFGSTSYMHHLLSFIMKCGLLSSSL